MLSLFPFLKARPKSPPPITPAPVADGPLTPREALERLPASAAPSLAPVRGRLDFSRRAITEVAATIQAESLDISGCRHLRSLPAGLQVRKLIASNCASLRILPPGLSCYELNLRDTPIEHLPSDLRVEYRLDLEDCRELRSLPAGLRVGFLNLRGCVSLEELPERLEAYFLDLTGCTAVRGWPRELKVTVGRLSVGDCPWVTEIPTGIRDLAHLDVGGCGNLRELPEGLRVSSWVELADSGIRALPESLRKVRLRWRGVPVERRVVFQPDSITAQEVLRERNAELRRVLLERMGYERFLAEADARIQSVDQDAGGERRLLRVRIPGDEDLVCLSVFCPSTGRQYLLRVPPKTKTCHQAAAWIAGFDNPNDYRPIAET